MSEHDEQAAVFRWAKDYQLIDPRAGLLYAIPNAGKRTIRGGKWMKSEGLRAGVPDLCLPVPSGGYAALYIEMKSQSGRTTKQQEWWIFELGAVGNRAVVCRSAKEAIDAIERYLA